MPAATTTPTPAQLAEIPLERRLANCRANVAALAARGLDPGGLLAGRFEDWARRTSDQRWFESEDGSVVRVDARGASTGDANHRTAVEHSVAAAVPASTADFRPPITIEGLDPPWLALAMHERTADPFNGYTPAIHLLQSDPDELLDGLATADCRPMLADERVTIYFGRDAAAQYRDHLRARRGLDVIGQVARNPRLRAGIDPPLARIHAEIEAERTQDLATLRKELEVIYAGRDKAWWSHRYEDATRENAADPLRVLVLSCRFTTYIRHANEDLADAFEHGGARTRIVVEPDDHHRLSDLAYGAAIREFEPDLVVLVNYPRSSAPDAIPDAIPFLCWVQDSMPHQFEPGVWSARGGLDYVIGHVARAWHDEGGLPREKSLRFPVVASERKFHSGPLAPREQERYACEVAYASRHSETPEDLHTRLVADWSRAGGPPALLEAIRPLILTITEERSDRGFHARALEACRVALAAHTNAEPAASSVSVVCRLYAIPLMDRIMRHQMLEWSAALADRRGWRLAIYGRGWETHPRLSAYARGELTHGDELRAAYRAATVNLHASPQVLLHQRVIECVLSGGLPLCRLRPEDIVPLRFWLKRHLWHHADRDGVSPDGAYDLYDVANHPAAMRCEFQLQRLGRSMAVDGRIYVSRNLDRRPELRRPPSPHREEAAWPLVDLAETTFETKDDLETLVRRAVERPRWRAGIIEAMAARIRGSYTTAAFAERTLDFIKADLASSSADS